MENTQLNKERIHSIANKMGLKFADNKDSNILTSRMLNLSKPCRPEVRVFFQRQLENVVRRGWYIMEIFLVSVVASIAIISILVAMLKRIKIILSSSINLANRIDE